jgi:hypothetical protein
MPRSGTPFAAHFPRVFEFLDLVEHDPPPRYPRAQPGVLQRTAFRWAQVAPHSALFLFRYSYFGEFSPHRSNHSCVLRLARTPCQCVSSVSSVRNWIFSGDFFNEVRLRKFFSLCRRKFSHGLQFSSRTTMGPGGKGSFQAVKLQRPARATVCSHSQGTWPPCIPPNQRLIMRMFSTSVCAVVNNYIAGLRSPRIGEAHRDNACLEPLSARMVVSPHAACDSVRRNREQNLCCDTCSIAFLPDDARER